MGTRVAGLTPDSGWSERLAVRDDALGIVPELQALRARGWANDYEESEIGAHGIAIGVPGMTQAALAALEVIAPVERMPRTRHHQLATLRNMRTALEVMAKGGFPWERDDAASISAIRAGRPTDESTFRRSGRHPVG